MGSCQKQVLGMQQGLDRLISRLKSWLPCVGSASSYDDGIVEKPSGKMTVHSGSAVSRRAQKGLVPTFSYFEAIMEALGSKAYDPETRRDGIICLAVAENILNFDMLKTKMASCHDIPQAAVQYAMNGYPPFLEQCAKFMSRRFIHSHPVDANRLIVSAGCGAVIDNVFWALCDPGDAVIIPAPCYPAFQSDLTLRDDCHVVYTKVHPEYRLTEDMLDEAYRRGMKEAGRVRALLLTNPNNPQGLIYTRSELEMIARWAADHDVQIVCDEIYANSVFNPSADCPFISMADVVDMAKGNVHIIWGFSKDFGINGFRVGVFYTQNDTVFRAVSAINFFSLASNETQHILSVMLQDEGWTDTYLAQSNDRVLKSYKALSAWLDSRCIPYYVPRAAQFCWMDLRKYLPEHSWEGEMQLFNRLWKEAKVVVSPGRDCHMDTPGFFRCCFPSKSLETLNLAIERMDTVLCKA